MEDVIERIGRSGDCTSSRSGDRSLFLDMELQSLLQDLGRADAGGRAGDAALTAGEHIPHSPDQHIAGDRLLQKRVMGGDT